jgi:solute carrier family 35 protein E1
MAFPSRHRPYHLPYEVVQPYNDSYGYPVVNGNGNGEAGLDRLESAAWTGGEVKRGWKGHFTPISPTAPSRGLPDTFSPLSLAIPKPSPSTIRFILLCSLWYTSSALSSNTAKVILNKFPYPITLTIVQFALTSACCLALSNPVFGMTKLRRPTIGILQNTLPMAAFQVGGHILSSMAMNRIPVSTVHTIKVIVTVFPFILPI